MKFAALCFLALVSTLRAANYPGTTGIDTARSFPYSMIGQVLYQSGKKSFLGSGTVIAEKGVLTAAHNIYSPTKGWSTRSEFRRSNYGTNNYVERQLVRRQFVLGGYRSAATFYGKQSRNAFDQDMGGLVFAETVGGGGYAGWASKKSLLTGTAYNVALGYGGNPHSGEELLFVEPDKSFARSWGAFFINHSIAAEPGMSGGPVFAEDEDGDFYVAAIVISGSYFPATAGIRIINDQAAKFIRKYLP